MGSYVESGPLQTYPHSFDVFDHVGGADIIIGDATCSFQETMSLGFSFNVASFLIQISKEYI